MSEKKPKRVNVSDFMLKLKRITEDLEDIDPLNWVLLILYAANGKLPSKVHIQKALFIASRGIDQLSEALGFKAYRMGPWSEEVSDKLEVALNNGLVSETEDGFILTDRGIAEAEESWKKLDEKRKKALSDIAEFVKGLSEDELLLYIYVVYGFSEKSDVMENLLRKRKELAVSMLQKKLISVELAAEIAGEPLPRFVEYLRRRGIKPFEAEVSDIEEVEKIFNT